MATPENTKLCDFTTTNNNDFLCTPIAPPATTAEFFEIKPALLNLVMREQFSGVSSDDAAAHLNNFVELCEELKIGCYLCLRIVLIHGLNARMLLLVDIILPLKLYL